MAGKTGASVGVDAAVTQTRVTNSRARVRVGLRPYQASAITGVWEAWCSARRVLLTLPTGTGKTEVAASIVADYFGLPVLWIAHRRELVGQAVKRLVGAGVPRSDIGIILAGHPPDASRRVQVGSVETLRRRDLPPADLIVVDEAHHAAAATWAALMARYPGARVLGLSATPWRSGRKQLAEHFDVLVCGARPSELIRDGWMAEPRLFAPEDALTPDLSEVRKSGDDYNLRDLARATNRSEIVGDIVAHRQRHAPGLRAVAYAVNVDHARSIAEAFVAAGERWATLTGETPMAERAAMLAALEAGKLDGIANCMVLTEGWDCPAAKCIIVARPTASEGLHLQMVGRGLRPWKGVTPIILDHAGNARWFDLPQTDREMSLKRTPMRRGKGHGGVLVRGETGELVRRELLTRVGELVEVTGAARVCCAECGKTIGKSTWWKAFAAGRTYDGEWRCLVCRPSKMAAARAHGRHACAICSAELGTDKSTVAGRMTRDPSEWRCRGCAVRERYAETISPHASDNCSDCGVALSVAVDSRKVRRSKPGPWRCRPCGARYGVLLRVKKADVTRCCKGCGCEIAKARHGRQDSGMCRSCFLTNLQASMTSEERTEAARLAAKSQLDSEADNPELRIIRRAKQAVAAKRVLAAMSAGERRARVQPALRARGVA